MSEHKKQVSWVLSDYRTGNVNQAIALAESLQIEYVIKNIKYNLGAYLPNFLLQSYGFHINKKLSDDLLNASSAPTLIISAGRRIATIALMLKKHYINTKIIQIMHPCLPIYNFDLVILPEHDKPLVNSYNSLRIIGALNNITNKLDQAKQIFKVNYPNLKKFIAVLVGGNNKNYKFNIQDAIELINILNNLSAAHRIPLFISFSRRTPNFIKELFNSRITAPYFIYNPTLETNYNPYIGLLACAEFVITTVDSISMCSEAASTAKPLYIYCPQDFNSRKHLYFLQQLIDLGAAKPLTKSVKILEKFSPTILNESLKIATYIKNKYLK